MKKIIFCVFIFLSPLYASSNETIGTTKDSDIYRTISDSKALDGQLQLLIYNTSESNGKKIFNAPKYEIYLNEKPVATINQNLMDIASQSGNFNFLRIDLPTGKYKAAIKQKTLFNAGTKKIFEIIIQQGKSLPIVIENMELSKLDRIPQVVGNMLAAKADAEINNDSYTSLVEEMNKQAHEFNIIVQQNREEADKARATKAAAAAKQAEEWYKEREEQKRKLEEEKRKSLLAEEEKKRIAAAEKEAQVKLAIENTNKEDDATCKSFGAKFGTEPYVACRIALKKSRDEQIERENSNAKMRASIEEAKQQALRQQLQREYDNQIAEEKRQSELAAYQQRLAEEQRRRERAERLDAAQRAFEAAARLSQPVPGTPINSIPQIPFPQRTTCFRNGNYVDCRTQ